MRQAKGNARVSTITGGALILISGFHTRERQLMKNTKRKIAETVVGAAVGAAIAGPAGAVAGGLVGSQVAAHNPHLAGSEPDRKPTQKDEGDPIIHAQLKRILVPLDFSLPSRRSVSFARDWAERFGSEVCLLHVIEPMNTFGVLGTEPIMPPLPPVDLRGDTLAELERVAREEFPGALKVTVQVRDGIAYDQIAATAREMDADLIIIATHGRTGLSHALMGSTAERVVRHAPCPVLTLRRTARD
jgi:universal stress protein A